MFLSAFLIACVAFLFFVLVTKRRDTKFVQENGKSPPTIPILGSAELLSSVKNTEELLDTLKSVGDKYFEHGMAFFRVGPLKFVSVWDAELIEAVTNSPAAQTKGEFYRMLFSSISNGVFAHPGGQEWKELRKPLVQSMGKKYIENDYFNRFVFKTHAFIDFLKVVRDGTCFDIGKDACALVFEVFSATHMGVHSNELKERKWMVAEMIDEEFENSLTELLRLHHYYLKFELFIRKQILKIYNFMTSFKFFIKESHEEKSSKEAKNKLLSRSYKGKTRSISALFDEILSFIRLKSVSFMSFQINDVYFAFTKEGRILQNTERKAEQCLEWLLAERKRSGLEGLDGIEYYTDFLLKRKVQRNMNQRTVLRELSDVIAAGSGTTPTSVSSALVFAAMHPEVQDRLFKEQQEIFEGSDRDPTTEDLSRMKYLDMVFKETLRFVCPPGIVKLTEKACVIGNHELPKATFVYINLRRVHQSSKYYEKPDEFHPDHFGPEAEAKRPHYAFIPFGVGSRMCPGFQYATTLAKVVLSAIIRNFTVKTSMTMETIKYDYRLMLNIRGGYFVELNSRRKL